MFVCHCFLQLLLINGADRNLQEENGMSPLQFIQNYPGVYVSSDMVSLLNCELLVCISNSKIARYSLFINVGWTPPTLQGTEPKRTGPLNPSTHSEVCAVLWLVLKWNQYSCQLLLHSFEVCLYEILLKYYPSCSLNCVGTFHVVIGKVLHSLGAIQSLITWNTAVLVPDHHITQICLCPCKSSWGECLPLGTGW